MNEFWVVWAGTEDDNAYVGTEAAAKEKAQVWAAEGNYPVFVGRVTPKLTAKLVLTEYNPNDPALYLVCRWCEKVLKPKDRKLGICSDFCQDQINQMDPEDD